PGVAMPKEGANPDALHGVLVSPTSSVPVNNQAPGGAVGDNGPVGAPDSGWNAIAAVADTTTRDDRASGGDGVAWADPFAPIATDFVSADRGDAFGDPGRL